MNFMNEEKRTFEYCTIAERMRIVDGLIRGDVWVWNEEMCRWLKKSSTFLDLGSIYRVIATPTQIRWDMIPEEYKWFSFDADSNWYDFWKEKPVKREGEDINYWLVESEQLQDYNVAIRKVIAKKIVDQGTEHWSESLQERPNG